jgi:hypothetical protein
VASMPTWFTAAGHYASTWPLAANAGDPLWVSSASGATISGFTNIVAGSSAEVYGGTVSGSMTPTTTTGAVSLGVDQELVSCAWTAADAPQLAATGPAGTGPSIGGQLSTALGALGLGCLLLRIGRRRHGGGHLDVTG